MSDKIDIKGIDKAELLAALHNGTRPLGMGFLHARGPMTADDARPYLESGDDHAAAFKKLEAAGGIVLRKRLYFDYLCGRPLKVDIGGDELDPRLYDRDAGTGRCARVVASLRARIEKASAA
jgi:hypothetical protein